MLMPENERPAIQVRTSRAVPCMDGQGRCPIRPSTIRRRFRRPPSAPRARRSRKPTSPKTIGWWFGRLSPQPSGKRRGFKEMVTGCNYWASPGLRAVTRAVDTQRETPPLLQFARVEGAGSGEGGEISIRLRKATSRRDGFEAHAVPLADGYLVLRCLLFLSLRAWCRRLANAKSCTRTD